MEQMMDPPKDRQILVETGSGWTIVKWHEHDEYWQVWSENEEAEYLTDDNWFDLHNRYIVSWQDLPEKF